MEYPPPDQHPALRPEYFGYFLDFLKAQREDPDILSEVRNDIDECLGFFRDGITETFTTPAEFQGKFPRLCEIYLRVRKEMRGLLKNCAKEIGVAAPPDLRPAFHRTLKVTSPASGKEIHFKTLIALQTREIGLTSEANPTKAYREGLRIWCQGLKRLKILAGYAPFDELYFSSREQVRADLISFARAAGLSSPIELKPDPMYSLQAQCQNEASITLGYYLKMAKKYLEISDEKTLSFLLERTGFLIMNRSYFENTESIRKDLDAFCRSSGVAHPHQLGTKHQSYEADCVSGEKMTLRTWLKRRDRALHGHAGRMRKALREAVKQYDRKVA